MAVNRAENMTEHATDNRSEKTAEKKTEHVADNRAENATEKKTENMTEHATDNRSEKTAEKKENICIALLAHVDAGKTTLAEEILYLTGKIRKPGRVDHRNAFFDTYDQERARGITIFSKQAVINMGVKTVTLLDTPGHVDFSAEMERTLSILDYAILVISGADGVQGHVQTLWRLLQYYHVPVFLFINKMDQAGTDRDRLLTELRQRLSADCVDFTPDVEKDAFYENAALCSEAMMNSYLEHGQLTEGELAQAIAAREIFPCYFGSALKHFGVKELLAGMESYVRAPLWDSAFRARVFKISRDPQGNRLTHLRITGGTLRVKDRIGREKADQIRVYSGENYEIIPEASAGTVCAVTGLAETFCGQCLGDESKDAQPLLQPVISCRVELPEGCDAHSALMKLKSLEEENPELRVEWQEKTGEIRLRLMGEVQTEILRHLIQERFHLEVNFGKESIVYKETISAPVIGIGHFEPQGHYAEVHLLMEPGEPGSGLIFESRVREDALDKNWQRLILTHLKECSHPGVLVGAEITDMRITLVAGRAHVKHTEGGDFRQATYRAIRQGLKKADCVLLEPVCDFCLAVPSEFSGRAITDIQRMKGRYLPPETEGEMTVLVGTVPTVSAREYQTEVTSYTRGRGKISLNFRGYEPCHNTEEVIQASGYRDDGDLEHPSGSIFCNHGVGFSVPWDQVDAFAHADSGIRIDPSGNIHVPGERAYAGENFEIFEDGSSGFQSGSEKRSEDNSRADGCSISKEEIDKIFAGFSKNRGKKAKTGQYRKGVYKRADRKPGGENHPDAGYSDHHGANEANDTNDTRATCDAYDDYKFRPKKKREKYLLVDGYNIIFAWKELRTLAEISIDAARDSLMDTLCNLQGYDGCTVILVFDAYKVQGNPGSISRYKNIYVVYTREAETADQYIEKTVHEIGHKYDITVATSDALEQVIIWGQGALRMSAQELKDRVEEVKKRIDEVCGKENDSKPLQVAVSLPE